MQILKQCCLSVDHEIGAIRGRACEGDGMEGKEHILCIYICSSDPEIQVSSEKVMFMA